MARGHSHIPGKYQTAKAFRTAAVRSKAEEAICGSRFWRLGDPRSQARRQRRNHTRSSGPMK